MAFLPTRSAMISARPTNAPPQDEQGCSWCAMWMSSCCGCLRPAPRRQRLASVPSSDFQQRLLRLRRHVARDGEGSRPCGPPCRSRRCRLCRSRRAGYRSRSHERLEEDVLRILAHVARPSVRVVWRRRWRTAPRQRAGQTSAQRSVLPSPWIQKHDVALRQLHVAVYGVRPRLMRL